MIYEQQAIWKEFSPKTIITMKFSGSNFRPVSRLLKTGVRRRTSARERYLRIFIDKT